MSKITIFVLFLLVFPVFVYSQPEINTIAKIDIYGNAEIQHEFVESFEEVTLLVYSPESLDINPDTKYALEEGQIKLKNVVKGTRLIYLSKTFVKKDGLWRIEYEPLQDQSVELILPFSSVIKEASSGSFQSKERIGQIIEWDLTKEVQVNYDLTNQEGINYATLFYVTLVIFLVFLFFFVKSITKKPVSAGTSLFIEGIKRIKRPIVKRVIYAILVLTYEKKDSSIDQLKIRGLLKKEGFKVVKSNISDIVNGKGKNNELEFFITKQDSKIQIKEEAIKIYGLKLNAKNIIKRIRKENILEKEDDYGKM